MENGMTVEEGAMEVRSDPELWFTGWGYWRNEETGQAQRGPANILQKRMFEHYRRCQSGGKPCRMVILKYRDAGSSTGSEGLVYVHAQNYEARIGVIGTDYRASANMLEMCAYYGEHDTFPWGSGPPKVGGERKVGWQEWFDGEDLSSVPFDERTERVIATKIEFSHGSLIELYTAKNRESARSARLSGYHCTEVGRWPIGGVHDAGDTLTAMRNAIPKRGFHLAIEESTARGAAGAFYDTCRSAYWVEYADWPAQWRHTFPLARAEYGKELQFALIFAAWYEDERHIPEESLDTAQIARLEGSLDEDEKQLIARYQQDGPRGPRLGGNVDTTVWDQLAWRRSIIKNVCTRGGAEEFKTEYPAGPDEAFRASGFPALDIEGMLSLEAMARTANPEYGILTPTRDGQSATWATVPKGQALFIRWEAPIETLEGSRGCRYLLVCDPMTGADQVTGSGEKDRHAVFVIRDAYIDQRGRFHPVKVVARIVPPNQMEAEVIAREIYLLALYYGNATIIVEANCGSAILKPLATDEAYRSANLFQREEMDTVRQRPTKKLGWWTSDASRRICIGTLQHYIRERLLDVLCPHAVNEMLTMIIDSKGKARGSGSNHDDDAIALAIGLELLKDAHEYPPAARVRTRDWTGRR